MKKTALVLLLGLLGEWSRAQVPVAPLIVRPAHRALPPPIVAPAIRPFVSVSAIPRVAPAPALRPLSIHTPISIAPQLPTMRMSQPRPVIATHTASWHPAWSKNQDHLWQGHRVQWNHGRWVVFADSNLPYLAAPATNYPPLMSYAVAPTLPSTYNPYFQFGANPIYYPMFVPAENAGALKGAKGDPVVRQVQGLLQEEGYYKGKADGVLSQDTRDALRQYQSAQGMPATGEIDQPLLDSLGSKPQP